MEATPEQSAEGLAIVRVLAAVLDRLVQANGPIARADPGQITKFHAMKAPGIAIQQYLERIHKYASCSNECFILALIYVDRLIQRSNFLLTELNVHRVVITSVLLAAKFFDDAYYNNAYYAKVGGVLVSEMNGLEVDFLFRINFSLHVTPDVFDKYRAELVLHSNSIGLVVGSSPSPPLAPVASSSSAGMVMMDCHSPTSSMVPLHQHQPHHKIIDLSPTYAQQQHLLQSQLGGVNTTNPTDWDPLHISAEVLINASQIVQQASAAAHGMIVTNADEVCLGGGAGGDPMFFPISQVITSASNNHKNSNPWVKAVAGHRSSSCVAKPMMAPPSLPSANSHNSSNKRGVPFSSSTVDPCLRIFPIQSNLLHHHHHGAVTAATSTSHHQPHNHHLNHHHHHHHHHLNFPHPVVTGGIGMDHHAAPYNNAHHQQQLMGRMLAGVSGAGL